MQDAADMTLTEWEKDRQRRLERLVMQHDPDLQLAAQAKAAAAARDAQIRSLTAAHPRGPDDPPGPELILKMVAAYCHVSVEAMQSAGRTQTVVLARALAAWFIRTTGRSYPETARELGWANHSSAISACARARQRHEREVAAIAKCLNWQASQWRNGNEGKG